MALRIKLCRAEDVLEGTLRGYDIKGVDWPVMVTRLDGAIVATSSVCPHEDVSLLGGDFTDGVVTCPGHAYEVDLRTGHCLHDRSLMIRRYRVTMIADDVYIDLI